MDENILKYLEDVRMACEDVEQFFTNYPNRFDVFSNDRLMIRAVERSVEIMGESHKPNTEKRAGFQFA